MNCGIYCAIEYMKLLKIEDYSILCDLKERTSKKGLSVFDMTDVFQNHGYNLRAFRYERQPDAFPYIMFLPDISHYVLVEKRNRFTVVINDSIGLRRKVPVVIFHFIFSKYILMMI